MFPEEQIPCTKTLYNELWAGNRSLTPFDIPEALNRSSKKKRVRKNKRINGTSIEERPESIAERTECGHWEIDTVVGRKAGKGPVTLTLVEKKTDKYEAIKLPRKNADAVTEAMIALKEQYGEEHFAKIFKSITADNGTEFESFSELEIWGVKIYFAHPYSLWERPQNERHNRLFRRYIPKGASIENCSAEQIELYADEINSLPRKILGYATPEELFDAFLDRVYSVDNVHVD